MPQVGIVGPSGQGKSTSIFPNEELGIIGLNPKETVILNVSGKDLPVKGFRKMYNEELKNYKVLSTGKEVADALLAISKNAPHIKNVIIDDYQYLQSFEFAKRTNEKGYDKFNDIFNAGYKPLEVFRQLRNDLYVFCLFHEDQENGKRFIKTAGKMINQYVTIEGLFTVILFSKVEKDFKTGKISYGFETQTDGSTTAKSPAGMFDQVLIPNDLGYIKQKMEEYYEG